MIARLISPNGGRVKTGRIIDQDIESLMPFVHAQSTSPRSDAKCGQVKSLAKGRGRIRPLSI